jgi:hypothetical protein
MRMTLDDKHREGADKRFARWAIVRSPLRTRATATVLALALTAVALDGCGSSGGPSGAYTAHIAPLAGRNGGFIAGDWTVTFKSGGSYAITTSHPTVSLGVGKGSGFHGTTFVINPQYPGTCGPGPNTGTYRMTLSGNTLRFTPITEPCRIRGFILARVFTKR